MKELTQKQMDAVKGGISECGWLGFLTAVSCMSGMLWACAIGLAGYATLCEE